MTEVKLKVDGTPPSIKSVPKHEFFMVFLTLGSVIYALCTRWGSFGQYVMLLTVPIAFGLYAVVIIEINKGRRPKKTVAGVNLVLFGPLVVATVLGFGYYCYGIVLLDAGQNLFSRNWSPILRVVIFGALVLAIGFVLFFIRLRARFIYGFTETLAGLSIAAHTVYNTTGQASGWDAKVYFALLTAGIYLIVRGLDNMQQGAEKDSDGKSPVVRVVKRYFANLSTRPTVELGPNEMLVKLGMADVFFGMPSLVPPKSESDWPDFPRSDD